MDSVFFKSDYVALIGNIDTVRPARTVGELPSAIRLKALRQAARFLGLSYIYFGVPIYQSLNLSKAEAQCDEREWLMFSGEDLPLEYVNGLKGSGNKIDRYDPNHFQVEEGRVNDPVRITNPDHGIGEGDVPVMLNIPTSELYRSESLDFAQRIKSSLLACHGIPQSQLERGALSSHKELLIDIYNELNGSEEFEYLRQDIKELLKVDII